MNSGTFAGEFDKKMNESRLDEDLKALAKRPQADLPPDFNATVWSKIQRRETPAHAQRQNWLKALLSPLATPQWAAAALTFALLAGWALGRITTSSVPNTAETRLAASVTGEVIDMACYFDDGASGPDHAACARMCIASGLPVGLMAKDGTIYVLIGKQEPPSPQPAAKHESLNAQLAPYAAKIVTISGTIVSKRGVNVIENAQLLSEEALLQQSPDRVTDSKAHFTHFL
jgi:hypothetical protein